MKLYIEIRILSKLKMATGIRNPMSFYSIRAWIWVNFSTHGFVNG